MNTDAIFKSLFDEHAAELLSEFWDFGQKIVAVESQNTEFQQGQLRADALYRVKLEDGKQRFSHLEFQGPHNPMAMALRMMGYYLAHCRRHGALDIPFDAFVIYIGEGAGKHDTGDYPLGSPAFGRYQYNVIRLWEWSSKRLIATNNPAMMTLIGQSKLEEPEKDLRAAVDIIANSGKKKPEVERLLGVTKLFLPSDTEVEMMENFARDYSLQMETPVMRQLRQEGEAIGWQKGKQQGLELGRHEGQKLGFAKGQLKSVLDLLHIRYELARKSYDYVVFASVLEKMPPEKLEQAFLQAATGDSLNDFKAWFEVNIVPDDD